MTIAYHFTGVTLRDGRPVPKPGEWLEHDGPVVLCEQGLHASIHPFDALQYAPGPYLHKVIVQGDIKKEQDKIAGNTRIILETINANDLLRRFACDCALSVSHLWNMPKIVKDYLNNPIESNRTAAWYADWDAARDAAWYAVRDSAWYAAWYAARYAARAKQKRDFEQMVEKAFKDS